MKSIPQDPAPDNTVALLREGYNFIPHRCQRYHSDLFATRLLLQQTICMRGEAAAQLFYDTDRFSRQGAMPSAVRNSLLGFHGVQGLDGEAHQHRKGMLMSLMVPPRIAALTQLLQQQWHVYIEKWQRREQVVLLDELREVIFSAVCMWSGVPLLAAEVPDRTAQIGERIDGAATIGPLYLQAWQARHTTESWIADVIMRTRAGQVNPPPDSALAVISQHRDLDGKLLDANVAAVELINILRPTTAIARWLVFVALALHEHPHYRAKLQEADDEYIEWFVQEVRRYYPFFPMTAACVKEDFTWRDYHFPKGTRVLLDLYGTDHDARLWQKPEKFWPERFREEDVTPFNLIPQGGGDYNMNHRCAGEWITLALMKAGIHMLVEVMDYGVPPQDLTVSLSDMPAAPKSRFIISQVRRRS
ncbi:MAG: cytochrome P450 [Caldilineaceae bacterium]|nr:cytochrome P450 [Caldilineaceae bacterium]